MRLILSFFSPPLTMSLYETTIFTFKSAPALGLDDVLPPPKKDSKGLLPPKISPN